MKKFNFNFKFLDRFKKSKQDHDENLEEQTDQTDTDYDQEDDDSPVQFTEMRRDGQESEAIAGDESYTDENPEVFAEKTLSNYNLNKFREENQHLVNDYSESDKTDHNMSFEEMEMDPPEKPESVGRFKFKFPKFGAGSGERIRERFSGASPMKSIDKFSWNDFILKLFSPYTRGKIHGVFIILLVVTFTYLIGKTAALFIGRGTPMVSTVKGNISVPIEKSDTTLQDINRISSTNLFNVKESDKAGDKGPKIDIASIVCTDAERPTSEPLKLLDTIVLQDSVKSVASVQVRGSSELVNVREGEQLNNAVEVSRINRMKIILKNLTTGECEYIASEEEDAPIMPPMKIVSPKVGQKMFKSLNPSIKNVGNSFKIKRAFRDSMISNMSEVLTQAKAVQITNPDGSLAFKMTEVVPGSIYSQLNIQNDDVITSINGKKIENLNELMTLLGRIKEIDQFQIGLKRNGMNETLEYGFE
nr:PDZ domain-containing protein [Bacteriovorax sp. HI3]